VGAAAPLRRGRLPAVSSGSLALALGAATCAAVATAVSAFSVADRLHGTLVHAPGNWQSALSISVITGFAAYVGAPGETGTHDRRRDPRLPASRPVVRLVGAGLSAADERDTAGRVLSVTLCAYLLRDVTTF